MPYWKTVALALTMAFGFAVPAFAQPVDLTTELADAKRIYIPAEDLDVVVERDRRGVMLTTKKFNELLGLAKANVANGLAPKLPIVLTSSNYQARVAGDQLLLTVTAELTQFANDWQSIAFPTQRLSVEKATLDDQPAMLGCNPDGSLVLLSDQKGTHTLTLELSTELTSLGSDQVAAFSLVRAPSGFLSLTLPAGKRLLVGALQLERPAPLEEAADYKIAIGGAPAVQLRITDRAADNAADALTFATTGYGLHVAPGEVTWHALTNLQIFGKPIDRLTFSVPDTLEIADVEATGLEAWELNDDPEDNQRTVISLTFGQPFDGSRKISFKGVMAVETGQPWDVPPLSIANITSHIGQIVVQHSAGIRLRIEETAGVRRATQGQKAAADMPDDMSKFNATEFLRFDVWQPDFVLRLTTQPKQREVQTAVAAVLDVNATGLDLQALITVKTQFAPLFELDVRLPADWNVLTAQRDATPLKWQILSQEPGVNQLRILLDPPLAIDNSGTIKLSLRREVEGWPVEADPITVAIPELFLPQSNLNEGTIVVRGDSDLDLAALELAGLDTVPLKAEYERLRFQTQDTRYGGNLKVTRKPSRISAQTITISRLDPQTMHAFVQSIVEVQGGGVRSLKVALPESAGTALRFQCPDRQIVEQKPGAVQNGERIWTLQFDQRIRGVLPLFCDIELPRGTAKEFVVPQARFVDAERQNGFQAVEAAGEQRISIDAKGSDGTALVEVDPLDLPNVYYVPKERIVAVYRNVTPGATVTLTEERFDKLPAPTAICSMLDVTSVLGRTGEMQHRATFQLTAVGVQGLRVILPAATSLWATLVDGQPVEVRRQGDVYLVPLNLVNTTATPSPGSPHQGHARQLQLFYRSEVPALTKFGTFDQAPPELAVQTGQGTSQPVDVLDQRWQLHYPPKTLFVSSDGPLEPEQPLDKTSLLGRLNTRVKVPRLEVLGWQVFAIVVTLGILAAFVLAYRRGSGIGVAGLVLFLVFVGIAGWIQSTMMTTTRYERMTRIQGMSVSEDQVAMTNGAPAAVTASPAPESAPGSADGPFEEAKKSEQSVQEFATPDKSESDERTKRMKDIGDAKPVEFAPPIPTERKLNEMEMAQDQRQPQPQDPQAPPLPRPVVPRVAESAGKNKQGLLSLALDLTPPEGSLQKSFRYMGSDPARGGIALQLGYIDEHSGTVARIFLVALLALIGWMLRRADCITKVTLAALGLTLPLAFLPLVPPGWQVILDGVFLGVAVVCGLWLLVGIARCLENCCRNCCGWGERGMNSKTSHGGGTAGSMLGAWVLGTVLLTGDASAQLKPNSPQASPNPQQQEQLPVERETTLVVPFDAGTDPLAAERIVLPFDKFLELYRQAHPDKVMKGTAPQPGGVVEALYTAKIVPNDKHPDESTVDVTARYAVRSYVDGQLLVELPIGAVAARDAKLDGKNAPLIVEDSRFKVAVSTPGLHVIDFVFSVPLRLSGSTGSLTLPLVAVPSGKLSLTLPAKGLSVRINGSSTIFRRVDDGDVQAIELPVDKGGDLAISWQPEQAQGAAAAVVHVDSAQAVTLTDAGIRVSSGFQYRIRQGGVADVTFSLPATYRLQAVNGSDVGGWELQGEGDARKLRIIFRRNIIDTTQLTIETFLETQVGVEATVVEVPQLAPQEVTNEIGQVAVFAGAQFTLRADKVESLAQIDADKFNTAVPISRPNVSPQLAYRFSKRPFTLALRVSRQESQANVAAQQAAFVMLRKQQLTTRLIYSLTGAPRSSFSIALPAGYVVLDVKATGLHDWSQAKQDDASSLTIDLDGPRLGLAEVVLSGTVPRDNDASTATLEFPRPLDATKLNSTAAIWLDEGFTGTVDDFEGWRSVDADMINSELKSVRPGKPVQFAFQSTATEPSAITLQLQKATPRLTANGLAMVSVTDVAVIHTLALQWQIDTATTDSLVFSTPSFLAGKLEFTGPGIRETTHVDAGNGRTRWTIWLRTPVSGKYFALAVATLPPAATEVVAPSIIFERATGDGVAPGQPVAAQNQYVLLINLSQSQLTSAAPELSEAVQREDVPVVVDQSLVDQATELVRVKQLGTAPSWTLQTFAQTASAPASVNVADLTTIVSRDGTYRGQAIYTIKNRSRQFLALKLPENAELMSVFVGGLPSRAVTTTRNNVPVQLIALPKTSAASLSFPVRIIWRGRLSPGLPKSARITGQEVDFPAPTVISQQDDPDFGIPVARTRWTVWLPDDLDAHPLKIASRYNMSLQTADTQDLLYEKAAIQELSELVGFVELNYSFSSKSEPGRRSQARNNMKQLGLALHNAYQIQQSVGNVSGDQEFIRQRDVALKRLSEVQESIVADQRQATPATPAPPNVNAPYSRGIQFQVEGLESLDQQPVYANTNTLLQSNGASVVLGPTGGSAETFNFKLKHADGEEASATAKQPGGKPTSGKVGGNVANLETRLNLQIDNGLNIDALNENINQQKLMEQQLQQPLQRGRMQVAGPMGNASGSGTPQSQLAQQGGFIGGGGYPGAPGNTLLPGQAGGGQPGRGGQSGLWTANPINPQLRDQAQYGDWSQGGGGGQQPINPQGEISGLPFGLESVQQNRNMSFNGGLLESERVLTLVNPQRNENPNATVFMTDGTSNAALMGEQGLAALGIAQAGAGNGAGLPGSMASRPPTGGLSLGFELPTTGRKLVFSKAGGDPKLALALRPRESIRWGLNLVWTAVWLTIGIGTVMAVRGASTGRLSRQVPIALAVLGVLGFLVLPSPLSGCAFATFVIASIVVAWMNRDAHVAA
jgi:hypothetical protein